MSVDEDDYVRVSSEIAIPQDVEEFLQHWRAIGGKEMIPTLQEFLDFRPFKLQSEVAIVDVVSPSEMRIRLFGTGLSSLAGRDLTGTDVLSNFHVQARAEVSRNAWTAVTWPCGYFVQRELRRGVFETSAIGIGLPLMH